MIKSFAFGRRQTEGQRTGIVGLVNIIDALANGDEQTRPSEMIRTMPIGSACGWPRLPARATPT